jgi:hypothetical protein
MTRAGGAIAIETDRVYLPGIAEGTADKRHLGVRLFECYVDPVRTDPIARRPRLLTNLPEMWGMNASHALVW